MANAVAIQCLGRLVRDGPGGMMTFSSSAGGSDRTSFHIPFRCDKMGLANGLCGVCLERERRTAEKVGAARGMTIGATHPSLLHGRVGEPIPFWSHIFGGAWFNLKMESGYTLSTEAMGRAKKAVEAIEPGAQVPAAEPMPEGMGKRGRKAKGGAAPVAPAAPEKEVVQTRLEFPPLIDTAEARSATPPPLTITVPKAPPSPTTPASATSARTATTPSTAKKRGPKKATGTTGTGQVTATPLAVATAFADPADKVSPVEDIVRIVVKRVNIDGRGLYLDPKKQKLYDMKYKYVGRYDSAGQRIDKDFPDSDAEP